MGRLPRKIPSRPLLLNPPPGVAGHPPQRSALALVALLAVALLGTLTLTAAGDRSGPEVAAPVPDPRQPGVPDKPNTPSLRVVAPPPDLPEVDYGLAPGGFPPDPDPLSPVRLAIGLVPLTRVAAYDSPGGRPRAFLTPTISGVPLTVPVVSFEQGWAAVLLPSANRTLAWVPPGGWSTVPLRDLLVVVRKSHELHWFRDDRLMRTWRVSLGTAATPTPLGRTFVLGRSTPREAVYAGVDVLALGSVPDDPYALPPGLRGAHIGVHTWYHDDGLGKNVTDGCVRLTRTGQELLLAEIPPGTEVLVVEEFDPASVTDAPSPPAAA
jgi:hypothetical protein